MPGLFHHMLLTLRLNFRSKQAVIYGFAFPLLFLFAFWAAYSHEPLTQEMGKILTVTILSGACFGMPTAMVSERERGVWRRYRLLPAATGGIVLSAMVVRVVLVAIAMAMQVVLAHYALKADWPAHPVQLAGVSLFVMFAFLGLGLIIAMLADNVPAVQAMGQMVFLPMLIIGGVGVRLAILPEWARHIAAFLPGIYAVDAIDATVLPVRPTTALPLPYCLFALTLIGLAGLVAGRQMFRWDVAQKLTGRARGWVTAALAAWLAVGGIAEATGRVKPRRPGTVPPVIAKSSPTQPIEPTSKPATQVASTTEPSPPASMPAVPTVAKTAPWVAITDDDINKITFDDLQPDTSTVTPVAANLDNLDEDGKKMIQDFSDKLDTWDKADKDTVPVVQRVRNLLAVCAIVDILQDQHEAEVPYVVFDHIRYDVGDEQKLKKVLAYIILHPSDGTVPTKVPELGFDGDVFEEGVRDRTTDYARKLLARVLGKVQ